MIARRNQRMRHIQGRDVRGGCQQLRSSRVQGQTRRVRFVHPLRVARQRAATGLRRLTLCGQRGPIGPGSGVERRPELLAHGIRPRTLVVQVEREGAEPDGIQSILHDLQRRALLRDEEHALAGSQRARQQVRDGLRFTGARRTFEHERATLDGFDHGLELRRVRGDGNLRRERIKVDVDRRRYRIDVRLIGRLDEVGDERVRRELSPVVVEIFPQPELRELQDAEVNGVLDDERSLGVHHRLAHRIECSAKVDSRGVRRRIRESRHLDAEAHLQLLEEAVVRRGRTRLIEDETEGLPTRHTLQGHRHKNQRRLQLPVVELPTQGAEREVQVVRAGLFGDRLGFRGQSAQPRRIGRLRDVVRCACRLSARSASRSASSRSRPKRMPALARSRERRRTREA